ncbi:MAG: heme-binding domain-containing protein [Ferruginibacter sp.]
MKIFFKRLLIILLIAFIAIQFIRPAKNISDAAQPNDISTKYAIPADVQATLKASCYDCHSNNTKYPWYNNIQPVAWFLADHVKEAKKELNFNEFASYKIGKQYRKLEEINGEVQDEEMPIESYTFIHGDAKLTELQKAGIKAWVNSLRDSIKAQYPADSLVRKQTPKPAATS